MPRRFCSASASTPIPTSPLRPFVTDRRGTAADAYAAHSASTSAEVSAPPSRSSSNRRHSAANGGGRAARRATLNGKAASASETWARARDKAWRGGEGEGREGRGAGTGAGTGVDRGRIRGGDMRVSGRGRARVRTRRRGAGREGLADGWMAQSSTNKEIVSVKRILFTVEARTRSRHRKPCSHAQKCPSTDKNNR